jgi:DNA polymerase-3 subunit epsilon
MREIVLDTETTGLDPKSGDRVVEIGCIELLNYIPSGQVWHEYLNPDRDMPQAAFEVHGLSTEFLSAMPRFSDLAEDFLKFIDGDRLIIHNASFDIGFLNAELDRLSHPQITMDRVIDTLALARRKHPGASNSLDALCKRYQIDNAARTKHGALLDSELLAEVYIELTGRRQADLGLASIARAPKTADVAGGSAEQVTREILPSRLTAAEADAHRAFVETLGPGALWHDILRDEPETT